MGRILLLMASLLGVMGYAESSENDALHYLRQQAGGQSMGNPEPTPVDGIQQVRLGDNTVYVSRDGRYVFVGSLLDLKSGRNLTAEGQKKIARKLLDAFGNDNKVIFKAKGDEKAVIDVFTDTSCPYCRKLHAEVPKLRSAGVTVRYLPYPRGGSAGPGYKGLRQVWCADDPVKAMDASIHGKTLEGIADCPRASVVDKGHELGNRVGLKGTPTIYLPDGSKIGGYVPASELLKRIE